MSNTPQNQIISKGGCLWDIRRFDNREVELLMQQCGLPYAFASILTLRGITSENIDSFLNPKLTSLMPNPSVMKDMDKAALRIAQAIREKQRIGIIGDYDVDGATSTALMRLFLQYQGITPLVHIPDRDEGYGPSTQAVDDFAAQGVDLIITVDCGTTAFIPLEHAAQDLKRDVIVLDHHEAETKLPQVYAIVNPKRLDDENDYPYLRYMAACGVVFMTIVAVNRELRNTNFYNSSHPEPDLKNWLDIVALGTVCDVVPLQGLNRAYVAQGLKVMAQRNNIGITALMDKAGLDQPPKSFHLGYLLGPRINAGGRVGDANIGNRLLCCQTEAEAEVLVEQLNQFNAERKDIENHVLMQAIEQLEGQPQNYPIAFVYGSDWHQGVIGIVAGRLRERYNVPAFVMSIESDEVKGSARSIPEVDLGALIISAKEKGLITKGGGHNLAAGFSLEENQIEAFRQFAGEYVIARAGEEKVLPVKQIDAVLDLGGANEQLAEYIEQLEPFGQGNPEPLLMLKGVRIIKPTAMGIGHIRCILVSDNGDSLKAVAFRVGDNEIGYTLMSAQSGKYDVCGTLKFDRWNGRQNLQFIIDDIRDCA